MSDALRSVSFLNGVTGLELKDASEQGRPCRVRRGPGRTALLGKRAGLRRHAEICLQKINSLA